MTELDEFRGERAGRAADALMKLFAIAVRAGGRERISGDLIELEAALTAAALVSDNGSAAASSPTIDWRAPADAGQLVGIGARRVRQLASAGIVRHRKVGQRAVLVDAGDLQRHYRERGTT